MNRISSRNARAAVLQAVILALLMAVVPAVAQNNDGTTTNTTTATVTSTDEQLKAANQELLNADKFRNTYAGMGEDINVRKDAWSWYWNEKAHVDIDTQNTKGFWGNDVVSAFFKGIADNFVVPFWNGAMEYDFIRVGLLLVVAGMLLGFGATLVMPKKPEAK
jgi:hypothetical protein